MQEVQKVLGELGKPERLLPERGSVGWWEEHIGVRSSKQEVQKWSRKLSDETRMLVQPIPGKWEMPASPPPFTGSLHDPFGMGMIGDREMAWWQACLSMCMRCPVGHL